MAFVKWSLDTERVSKAEMGKHVRFTNELMVIALVFWGLFFFSLFFFVLLGGVQKPSTMN